ncbi:hypothetical protein [Streptomyces sp. STR69]|uniref:hypothetical protein n=1 Tax=Streptomyces sp. STR69 TaxID=1796942 RepID=UPI0021CA3D9B|nr:hypothetical protein [Streptomyces sp. STR69]
MEQYPGARAFALPEVVEDMAHQSSPEVLKAVWRAWFPEQIPERLVLAEPLEGEVLTVGGAEVRPVRLGHTDSDKTTCLHVPDLGLVVAGDVIYNNVHLMLAASDADGRDEWLRALDTVEALVPTAFAAWMSTDANDGLPVVATLVGAILLARATAGTELPEKILESTHKALTVPRGPRPGTPGPETVRRGLYAT